MSTVSQDYIDNYHDALGFSTPEKLFFLDHLPGDIEVFADFGCADGRLLQAVAERRPSGASRPYLMGYDHNPYALAGMGHLGVLGSLGVFGSFTSSLAAFKLQLQRHIMAGRKVCLILSSVIHEVVSQGTNFKSFLEAIFSWGVDYIAIRDMAASLSAYALPPSELEASTLRADPRVSKSLIHNVSHPGQFSSRVEMLEALLKYRYVENMEHELEETYLFRSAMGWKLDIQDAAKGRYRIKLFDHHSLAYHRDLWSRDFGLDITDKTHLKIVLEKVDNA